MLNLIADILTKGYIFFALHLKNTGSFPPSLSAEDEKKYLCEFKNGNIAAKNKITFFLNKNFQINLLELSAYWDQDQDFLYK